MSKIYLFSYIWLGLDRYCRAVQVVEELTEWVYHQYGNEHYDFIVGHSMGGIIALQLTSKFFVTCDKIIFIESNLKPAGSFYRNLLTEQHMAEYGNHVIEMIKQENPYYTKSLKASLQENFDFTEDVKKSKSKIYGIYGDRGQFNYPHKIEDLNLEYEVMDHFKLFFVKDACHMPMIENPIDLSKIILSILSDDLDSNRK